MNKIEGITLANCWAHARRKFIDIEQNYPSECEEILDLIDELFKVERKARTLEELVQLRTQESTPILQTILAWLKNT